mgnify:CR=1 FL=1
MNGGTLLDRENSTGDVISENEVVNLVKQIGEGIKHMHERNIVHLGKYSLLLKHLLIIRNIATAFKIIFRPTSWEHHVPNEEALYGGESD